MDVLSVLQQMLVLLLLLITGYICSRTGVVDPEGNKKLTKLTLAVFQSCMILSSVINTEFSVSAGKLLAIFFSGFVLYGILAALGALVWLTLRRKPELRGIFAFMTVFGNVGFMGFPVVSAVFGSEAVIYASIFNIPFNLLAYSVGPLLFSGGSGRAHIDWRSLVNAPLISTLIAIVLLFVRIPFPTPLDSAIDKLGDAVVPMSMIIIGASLGDMPLKEALGDWRCYVFMPVKLVAVPIAVFFVMGFLISDELLLGTMTILAGMPVAAVSVMLCLQHGSDAGLASKTVFLSTVFSTFTIPLICWRLL